MNQSAFFEALGWSLIDSLWQVGAVWLMYIITTQNGNRYSAIKRHTLALAAVMASTLLFFVSIFVNTYSVSTGGRIFSFAHFIEQQAETIFKNDGIGLMVPVLSYIYLPVLLFFIFRTVLQLIVQRNGYRRNVLPAGDEISELAHNVSMQLGITSKVVVWLSSKVESPLTIGFWKPAILLPIAMFSHLTYTQIEAVIAHELFHIKRNDYLVNIFLTVSETVLFFNPFAKLLAASVRKERENSCDDLVIAAGFDRWEYSEALYKLGRFRNEGQFALAATGKGKEYLLHRIRRIMRRNNPQPSVLKPFIAFFLCLVVACFASRQKNVAVLPEAKVVYEPVVYYSVEKEVKVVEPVIIKTRVVRPVAERTKPVEKNASVPPAPEAPPPPDVFVPADEDVVTVTFASAPEEIEFTIIDPAEPDIPQVTCETPQPYVPRSSFYFTEVDTVAGKKIISL